MREGSPNYQFSKLCYLLYFSLLPTSILDVEIRSNRNF